VTLARGLCERRALLRKRIVAGGAVAPSLARRASRTAMATAPIPSARSAPRLNVK
jgi:hypothetical protein